MRKIAIERIERMKANDGCIAINVMINNVNERKRFYARRQCPCVRPPMVRCMLTSSVSYASSVSRPSWWRTRWTCWGKVERFFLVVSSLGAGAPSAFMLRAHVATRRLPNAIRRKVLWQRHGALVRPLHLCRGTHAVDAIMNSWLGWGLWRRPKPR